MTMSTLRFNTWENTGGTEGAALQGSGDANISGNLDVAGNLIVTGTLSSGTPIISGRLGSSGAISSDQLVLFDEFWVQRGITFNSTTRRFTVPSSGIYRITFDPFWNTSASAGRVLIGVNTDAPIQSNNYGHSYRETASYDSGSINSVVSLNADDYIVYRLFSGSLYNGTNDRFNTFSIARIA